MYTDALIQTVRPLYLCSFNFEVLKTTQAAGQRVQSQDTATSYPEGDQAAQLPVKYEHV
jgi:hypothetical protein